MNGVKPDESGSDPGMEEDAPEVNKILEDPSPDNFSVNGVLSFDKDITGMCFGVEDFNGEAMCDFGTNSGAMSSYITQDREDELNLGVLDGILDEIDENLDYVDGLADGCEDYLLDIDLVQEVSALNSGLCDGIRIGNSSSDSHSPGYSASSNGAVGMSDSSAITNSDISYRDELNHKSGYDLSYGASRVKRSRSRNNRDKTRKISLQGEKFTDCHPSVKNGNSPEVVASVREKRQRKPPQRYIEESSNSKTEQHPKQGHRLSAVVPKVKHMKVGPIYGQYHATPRLSAFVSDNVVREPCGGGSTTRQLFKKHTPECGLLEDSSGTESELEFSGGKPKKKRGSIDRRKQQRMWTLQEVINLVDGIAKYGVGRWTDIKRLSFASASYRTPIDLRDKWRNLLRASRAHRSNKEEDGEKQSSGRVLPKSLLCRIDELATVHPYPRKDRSRSSPIN